LFADEVEIVFVKKLLLVTVAVLALTLDNGPRIPVRVFFASFVFLIFVDDEPLADLIILCQHYRKS
jgi:hypothetical protein